uniref:Uncharacterized protein n=1 Tax=Rhizophora mucronata TaxID=61149 RepID=A0A2P2N8Q5_RHIMU
MPSICGSQDTKNSVAFESTLLCIALFLLMIGMDSFQNFGLFSKQNNIHFLCLPQLRSLIAWRVPAI